MEWIKQEAQALQAEMTAHRRWLHQHAQVGFNLTETRDYVARQLEEMGITPTCCGKAGLTALLGKPGGKTLLLRADMDALPIREESGEAFACPNGAMHACGHDLHTAMLLGAAKLLKAHEAQLSGQVKLMFQGAEETFEGAKDMLAHGVLENPRPDGAMMLHVTAATPMPTGTLFVCAPGVSAPAADYFTITVQGRGCHGSTPENGVDALTAGAHILLALQELHARELPAGAAAVLTVGSMHGGTAPNAIADQARLQGTIRTYDEETRAFLKERMTQISTSVAQAYRAKAEVEFGSGCPTLVNDGPLARGLLTPLRSVLGNEMVIDGSALGSNARGGGSEDFAYISQEVPSIMMALAAGSPEEGYRYPQHHPKVRFDESVLSVGAAAFTVCAFGFLTREEDA